MYCEAAGGLLLAWSYDDESTYSGEVQVKILRAVVASFVRSFDGYENNNNVILWYGRAHATIGAIVAGNDRKKTFCNGCGLHRCSGGWPGWGFVISERILSNGIDVGLPSGATGGR